MLAQGFESGKIKDMSDGKVFLFVLLLLLFVPGCGTVRRFSWPYEHTYFPISSTNTGFTKEYPKSFTVYPFKNLSWYRNAGQRARRAIFKAFSLIGPCASMQETDKLASNPYTLEDALKVARRQKSDALIVGEVKNQQNSFLLLYAYNYIELEVTVYDTRTGLPLWTGSDWGLSNQFGALIFWIPNPILPLIENIFWSRVSMDLYNRIAMDAVYSLRPDLFKDD